MALVNFVVFELFLAANYTQFSFVRNVKTRTAQQTLSNISMAALFLFYTGLLAKRFERNFSELVSERLKQWSVG